MKLCVLLFVVVLASIIGSQEVSAQITVNSPYFCNFPITLIVSTFATWNYLGGDQSGCIPDALSLGSVSVDTITGFFDVGLAVSINGEYIKAPSQTLADDYVDDGAIDDKKLNKFITKGANKVAGIQTSFNHYYLVSAPYVRVIYSFWNTDIKQPVTFVASIESNMATNEGTIGSFLLLLLILLLYYAHWFLLRMTVNSTSSGDDIFTTADRWIVMTDSSPINRTTTAFFIYSIDSTTTPSNVSTTVFTCNGDEGVKVEYTITLQPSQTFSLAMFVGVFTGKFCP